MATIRLTAELLRDMGVDPDTQTPVAEVGGVKLYDWPDSLRREATNHLDLFGKSAHLVKGAGMVNVTDGLGGYLVPDSPDIIALAVEAMTSPDTPHTVEG